MKRIANVKIPENQFSYTLQKEIIDNYLPKDSKITLFTPNPRFGDNNYYIRAYSDQFKEIQEGEVIPKIKIALTKHPTLNYYTITAFDMSHVLDTNATVTLPKGVVIDKDKYIVDNTKPFDWYTPKPKDHSCKFDQQYTGLVESFKYCICGKKE